MKGIRLLFIACLAPLLFGTAVADNTQNSSRSSNRRTTSTTTSGRERTNITTRAANSTTTPSRTTTPQPVRDRTNTATRSVSNRTNATPRNIQSRTVATGAQLRNRATPRGAITTRASTTRATGVKKTNLGRNATTTNVVKTPSREDIMSRDTKKCREVFYGCMDEFCANKDAQLKRCACSTRINEFHGLKENLEQVEDKLLDFSQRLLTVNMEAEDAAALNQATAGELAFSQADKSQSKQMLDEIAKKLNTSFDNSNFDQSLNAISLSLDMDAAFDSIDPTAGASTTTKSGTALYSAALPTCREMALEVCSPDELTIAEGGYQMLIEQDCNTVKKTYQTQSDQARSKVFESSALLDMSRLDIHQQRNSDDILTCKSKMLDMLTNSTVCGENMEKCLDTTGRYIDPSTGDAILTTSLANLSQLIIRPTSSDTTWSSNPTNARYISFLNTKKKFLEPAMEKCQDIADTVWTQFLDDALAQIKLAQDKKLEEIRQSCTTLLAQCLDQAADSITDFDERALSIFGVAADKTAKAMCADIKTSCTALFEAMDKKTDTTGNETNDWESGVTEITNTKSYETILSTCREVGRNCIIQSCRSIEGNFALCTNIDKSINRKAIINRRACWNEVMECVANAGEKTIEQIMEQQGRNKLKGYIYETLYQNRTPYDNLCKSECDGPEDYEGPADHECRTCRLTEQIWGNCEQIPSHNITEEGSTNRILVMTADSENETLLSWFARNTGTANDAASCRDTSCPPGYTLQEESQKCVSTEHVTKDGFTCDPNAIIGAVKLTVKDGIKNCCFTNTPLPNDPITPKKTNDWHYGENFSSQYCCQGSTEVDNIQQYLADFLFTGKELDDNFYKNASINNDSNGIGAFCGKTNPTNPTTRTAVAEVKLNIIIDDKKNTEETTFALICMGSGELTNKTPTPKPDFPSGQNINCDGTYVLVSENGLVVDPFTVFGTSTTLTTPIVETYYYKGYASSPGNKCVLKKTDDNNTLAWIATYTENNETKTDVCAPATNGWQVTYNITPQSINNN